MTTENRSIRNIDDILKKGLELEYQPVEKIGCYYSSNKGFVGNQLEVFFGLKNSNSKDSDFKQIGINAELKSTPIKLTNSTVSSKERLILSMINYNGVFHDTFLSTDVYLKIKNTIIVNYFHDLKLNNKVFGKTWLLTFTKDELDTIEKDYQIIKNKILSGKAHELSDSDTVFLSASRKGHKEDPVVYRHSNTRAKKRAWALKTTFMTKKVREIYNKSLNLEKLKSITKDIYSISTKSKIIDTLKKYIGMSTIEINNIISRKPSSNKSEHQFVIKKLLDYEGFDSESLNNEQLYLKVQKLNKNGKLQESISFKQIDFDEIINWGFDQTDICDYLNNGFIHVVFDDNYKLSFVKDVQFTDEQIQRAREGFDIFKQQIIDGKTSFIKSSDKLVIHVRPKAKDSTDTVLVNGNYITKQTMWINKSEIR